MKWPKVKVSRAQAERVLIASSAALVLLLSVSGRNAETEPYEERLEEIEQAELSVAAPLKELQQTVVYYEDADGYLVPVQRDVARQTGIAKATLSLMVQSAKNDMDAARLGLSPILPEGTTFDLDISQGHARVDLSSHALRAAKAPSRPTLVSFCSSLVFLSFHQFSELMILSFVR